MAAVMSPHPPAPPGYYWPTSVSSDGRTILDQNGQPWLMVSDQILPCLHNAALTDCYTVFADRQPRGFNAMWICLVVDAYIGALDTFVDNDGNVPFSGAGLSSPNAAYWNRVDQLVSTAALYGLTCLLTPIETAGAAFALA